MADGEIKIRAILDGKDAEEGIKSLESSLKSLNSLSPIFGKLGSAVGGFGKTFSALGAIFGSTAGKATAGVGLIVVAFDKLYSASRQNFTDNLVKYGNAFMNVGSVIGGVVQEIMSAFSQVTSFNLGFGSIVADAIEFESSIKRAGALMNVVGSDMSKLSDVARNLGASTRYTAMQISEAFGFMGTAGFTLNESMSSINDVLNVATIESIDLATASSIVTDGLTSMGMSASQASDFVDYMAATSVASNTSLEMMGESMKYVGSIAGTLGVDMSDLSVAMGLMANNGIKASLAGTSLRTLLTNLSSPTDKAAKAMAQYGIALVTADDGSVDLNATMQSLRENLRKLPLTEQAAAAKTLAGKTGMAGLLAIINATDETYSDLTETVENSTETISYWNENLGRIGVTGEKSAKRIEKLKEVLSESDYVGTAFNATTKDMALALQVLSADADISSKNVEDLFNVFSVMREPTKAQASNLKELGLSYRELDDDMFDYSKTCNQIDSSITGLTVKQKEQIKSQLDANMSMEEANKILSQYGDYQLKAFSKSTGQIDLIGNLKEMRETFGGMSEESRKAALAQLGLSSSLDEVNEICALSDEQFNSYCDNLRLVTGLSEKMAASMDETTKNGFLRLASAIADVGIQVFETFKENINGATKSLTDFFSIWRSGNKEGEIIDGKQLYSSENLNSALNNLLEDIKKADIKGAIKQAIDGAVSFITGGGLGGILEIGGEIVHQICQGIIQNKNGINEGVSSAIKQISEWIISNAGEIKEAGKVILNAIKNGIQENSSEIHAALDVIADTMNEWIDGSAQINALAGNFADVFINSLIMNTASTVGGKATEWWNAITSTLMNGQPDMTKGGSGFLASIMQWLFPDEASAGEKTGNEKPLEGGKQNKNTSKVSSKLTNMNTEEIQALKKELEGLQKTAESISVPIVNSFTNIQNGIRTSMLGVSNIVRNQFVNVSNIIRNQLTNARNSFTTQMISIKNVARVQSVETRNSITTQMISMRNVITTQSRLARNAFTTQMISIKNVARVQSAEAGRNIASGLASGLRSGTASAIAAARSMVAQVNAIIRSTAKISSPSKITEEYGMFMAQGLAVGFKKSMPSVQRIAADSIKSLNSTIKSTVNAEVSKVTVNAKATSSNNIINNSNSQIRITDEDISKLGKEISKRPVQVNTKIGEKTIVDALAKPIKTFSEKNEFRLKRLEGTI